MKKKLLLTLAIMALLVFVVSLSVSAASFTYDEVNYTLTKGATEEENTAEINSHKGKSFTDTVINIPAYIEYQGEKYYVTDSNSTTTFESTNVTEVYFHPDCKITRIRNYAFKNCKSLTKIVLPSKVEKLHWQAFLNCSSLTALYLPDTITEIGYDEDGNPGKNSGSDKVGVFLGCTKLYFVNNLGDTERPDVWYAPASLEKLSGEGIKELKNVSPVMVFGENFTQLVRGYTLADKNNAPLITYIFEGDFTKEGAVFQLACEIVNRNIYFTHPNVKDKDFLSYDTNYVNFAPTANIYFCASEKAYTLRGTASGSKTPTYTEIDFAHFIEKESVGVYYENYFEKGYVLDACYCGKEISRSEASLDPVVESRGVSVPEFDGSVMAVVQGIKINRDALAALGDEIDFGVIVDINLSGEAYNPIDSGIEGNSLMGSPYNYFDIKVSGIPSEHADTLIVFCAYLKVGENLYYLDNGKTSNTVIGNSYNSWTGGAK
ncbi:MAG: leucine-rich repeat protein [Clostridia bacterium]|nr:leucine-rich repeat protein [Clostridia bacterium]